MIQILGFSNTIDIYLIFKILSIYKFKKCLLIYTFIRNFKLYSNFIRLNTSIIADNLANIKFVDYRGY